MTPDLLSFIDLCQDAERSGALEDAYELHGGIPQFDRGRHRQILRQVSGYASAFTPWLWARWAIYLATRCEDPGTLPGHMQRIVAMDAVEMFHMRSLAEDYQRGGDPVRTFARVVGESWAYHQMCVEFPVVGPFMEDLAAGPLRDVSDLVRRWTETVVSGYEIEPRGDRLRVRDLASDAVFEPLDLGAGCGEGREQGAFVIGRLVPTGVDDRLMFDTRPLQVDERTAWESAIGWENEAWMDALTSALADGRMTESQLLSEDLELASDVPELCLVGFGTPTRELARVMDQLRSGRDEVGRAAFRILRDAADRPVDPRIAPYVAASVCHPTAYEQALRKLVRPGESGWAAWASLASGPAEARLLELAARVG